ncbi:hypothetical protein CERSUDRAFT_79578 [Gelatoporia subvermispora B]|uniref:Rhomboid-type serine protease n=1 Tax=Ceriporiopsis subvermispora (strain B) TaxID=914234 RepID=M2PYK9_CERS8|nr:hypothetical protein CERSUDRAFT_79578 [Gelatoporia subvermispora B]
MSTPAPFPEYTDHPVDEPQSAAVPLGHSRNASTTHLLGENDDAMQQDYREYDSGRNSAYKFSETDETLKGVQGYSSEALQDKDEPFVPRDAAGPYGQYNPNYQNLEYDEPFDAPQPHVTSKRPNAFTKYFGLYPLEQRIADKKRGLGVQQRAYLSWLLAVVMLGVIIYELVKNWKAQGTPVSFKPVVNPMLGPSSSALINVGARFPPCMKVVEGVPLNTLLPCLNDTANPPDKVCSLEDVCGFGGFHDETPNQWFRFITPIFLHAGIIHYLLNMLAQLTATAQVEREMGSISFLILYMASGIFGNVLGGNFSLVGSPSVGASGAIFGTVAVAWVDLFAHWRYIYQPGRKLVYMLIELVIGIAVGFIPYVDNFAHIGGLVMGLLVGMLLYPIISPSTRHRTIVICFRIAAIPIAVVLYVVLIRNFYTSNPYAACSWCRYLSCIPTSGNNHCKGTGLSSTSV